MFQKILIANRGEIALRIIRACKELGIATVAVYSEADRDALHVRFADEDICIGPPASGESYNNLSRIISAAEITNVDAIHPGYGFLAENSHFAEACESCDIKFIGPSSRVISQMGDKSEARRVMARAAVPIVPGTTEALEDPVVAGKVAVEIGYPLMIKAAAGGGGRGIRVVRDEGRFTIDFQVAQAEAQSAFGSQAIYLEKMIEGARHIEVQILGDQYGTIVHLGERDCSIQRRRQKLLEEAPSPGIDEELRQRLGEAAVRGAQAVEYENAGTMEFLMDRNGHFYFMEMNTRIQVEHPVTEAITGIDLIKEQIRIAAGEPLGYRQQDITWQGHAIECRINAEDPDKRFAPSTGQIEGFHLPGGPGVRIDTHIHSQYKIPPYYDAMLGKLICFGHDRQEAIARMRRALEELIVTDIKTTIPFHLQVLRDPDFLAGKVDTTFVDRMMTRHQFVP